MSLLRLGVVNKTKLKLKLLKEEMLQSQSNLRRDGAKAVNMMLRFTEYIT